MNKELVAEIKAVVRAVIAEEKLQREKMSQSHLEEMEKLRADI